MLTASEIDSAVKKIDTRRLPFGIRMSFKRTKEGVAVLTAMDVRDRNGSEMITIESFSLLEHIFDVKFLYLEVFRILKSFILHEVAECFVVDGVRIYDPHP